MLDEIGLNEKKDGIRLGPDGSPVNITMDIWTPAWDNLMETAELVKEYWEKVGIGVRINPVDRSYGVSRVASNEHEIYLWPRDRSLYPQALMGLLPTSPEGAPSAISVEAGRWFESGGEEGKEPEGDLRESLELWSKIRKEPDDAQRKEMIEAMVTQVARQCYVIGTVGMTPMPVVVKNNFHNVPEEGVMWDYVPLTPKNTFPEQYFISE